MDIELRLSHIHSNVFAIGHYYLREFDGMNILLYYFPFLPLITNDVRVHFMRILPTKRLLV